MICDLFLNSDTCGVDSGTCGVDSGMCRVEFCVCGIEYCTCGVESSIKLLHLFQAIPFVFCSNYNSCFWMFPPKAHPPS